MAIFIRRNLKEISTRDQMYKTFREARADIDTRAMKKASKPRVPSSDELAHIDELLEQLDTLNESTTMYQDQLDQLSAEQESISSREYNARKNRATNRSEKANREAWAIKKRLRSIIKEYELFPIEMPKHAISNEVEVEFYNYKTVHKDIEKAIETLDQSLSEGERVMQEYRKTNAALPVYLKE